MEESVDLSYLLSNAGFELPELADLTVCSILDDYRRAVGIEHCDEGVIRRSRQSLAAMGFSAPSFAFDEVNSTNGGDVSMHEDDPAFDEDPGHSPGGNFSEGKTSTPSEGRTSDASHDRHPDSPIHSTKFDWNAVFGEEPSQRRESQPSSTVTFDVNKGMTNADSFSFYSMRHQGNDWAGARHWKFALRSRARPEPAPEVMVSPAPKAKKAKKERMPLVFTAEPVDESIFDEKPRAGGHTLSASTLNKNADLAKQGSLLLPPDAHLETRDLCRLFLRPRMIVVPEALSSMLRPNKERSSQRRDPFVRDEDLVWGEVVVVPSMANFENPLIDTTANDDGNYFYEADEDLTGDDGNSDNPTLEASSTGSKGLEISMSGMAQAGRRAQKIDISYATSSKRVNVGKLKKDLWERLETTLAPKNADLPAENPHNHVSFQRVIAGLGSQQKQADATLPFYFICLLHLANEKVRFQTFLQSFPSTRLLRIW